MNDIKEFATVEDAFEWMYEAVDDGCIDNERFAYSDDEDAVNRFIELTDQGCCGCFDSLVTILGREAHIGCNYGH
jgi:hypothetical protein